jgi:LEA14-like dessication related protein
MKKVSCVILVLVSLGVSYGAWSESMQDDTGIRINVAKIIPKVVYSGQSFYQTYKITNYHSFPIKNLALKVASPDISVSRYNNTCGEKLKPQSSCFVSAQMKTNVLGFDIVNFEINYTGKNDEHFSKKEKMRTYVKKLSPPLNNLAQLGSRYYKLKLFWKGSYIGWAGVNYYGWMTLQDSYGAQAFQDYKWGSENYIILKGGAYDGYYLSSSKGAYLGAYSWNSASGFYFKNKKLYSKYWDDHCLSMHNTGYGSYLYTYNPYGCLTVKRVAT